MEKFGLKKFLFFSLFSFFSFTAHAAVIEVEGGSTQSVVDQSFSGQQIESDTTAYGGILLNKGTITELKEVSFVGNVLSVMGENQSAYGAALSNASGAVIHSISGGGFIDNHTTVFHGSAYGGAIYNAGEITKFENAYFSENVIQARDDAFGGAIYHEGGTLSFSGMNTFTGNQVYSSDGVAQGGAIYATSGDILFSGINIFSFNTANDQPNDIYLENGRVIVQDGKLYLDGGIFGSGQTIIKSNAELYFRQTMGDTHIETDLFNQGKVLVENGYTAHLLGQTFNTGTFAIEENAKLCVTDFFGSGQVQNKGVFENAGDMVLTGQGIFNNSGAVQNQGMLWLQDNAQLILAPQSHFQTGEYRASNNPVLALDVSLDATTRQVKHGVLEVEGDVEGVTNVVLHFLDTDENFPSMEGFLSPYVLAPSDDLATMADFKVQRVWGSPLDFSWFSRYNARGDETGSVWYLGVVPPPPQNPDFPFTFVTPAPDSSSITPRQAVYVPEIPVYTALGRVLYEQGRNIFSAAVENSDNRLCRTCFKETLNRGYVHLADHHSRINMPAQVHGHLKEMDLGFPFYQNGAYQMGLLGSYGKGKYAFSGQGVYFAKTGSELKVEDYAFGIYQQYATENRRLYAALFGGRQNLALETDDDVVHAHDHVQMYGVGIQAKQDVFLEPHFRLTPEISALVMRFDVADFKDNVGKSAKYRRPLYGEAALSVAFAYDYCFKDKAFGVYFKPAVVQTFEHETDAHITGMGRVQSARPETLGRVETGVEFTKNERVFANVGGGYTFGKDYNAYSLTIGLKVRF